ncbi:hypothetical protein B296_00020434, partial [Ensete ventricosum]
RATAPAVWPRAGVAPLRAGLGRSQPPLCRGPCHSRPPLCMGALVAADRPLQGAWPHSTALLQGELGYSRPPLQGGWPEIVYPCIPDPDGEDEGGQASSSQRYPHDGSLQ